MPVESKVKVVQAALDTKKYERRVTGGSGAIPPFLGSACGRQEPPRDRCWWKLPQNAGTCRLLRSTTDKGIVSHKESGRKLTYGELASEASAIPVPTEIKLKDKKDFKIIRYACTQCR